MRPVDPRKKEALADAEAVLGVPLTNPRPCRGGWIFTLVGRSNGPEFRFRVAEDDPSWRDRIFPPEWRASL